MAQVPEQAPRLAADAVWLTLANGLNLAQTWVLTIVLAKFAAKEHVGELLLAFAVVMPLWTLATLQLRSLIMTHRVTEDDLASVVRLRGLGLVWLVVTALLLGWAGQQTGQQLWYLGLLAVGKGFELFADCIYGYMAVRGNLRRLAALAAGRTLLQTVAFAVGERSQGLTGALSGLAMASFLSLMVEIYWGRPARGLWILACKQAWNRAATGKSWPVMKLGVPLTIVTVLGTLSTSSMRLISARFLGLEEVAVIASLNYFSLIPSLLVVSLCQAAQPRLAQMHRQGTGDDLRLLRRLLVCSAAIGLLFLVGSEIGGEAITTWLYGVGYYSHPVLRHLMIACVIAQLVAPLGVALTAYGAYWAQVPMLVAALVVLSGGCWVLAPKMGMVGVAVAMQASLLTVLVVSVWLVWRHAASRRSPAGS